MLSRVADSLYWMSRYLERAEHTARLIEVDLQLRLDQSPENRAKGIGFAARVFDAVAAQPSNEENNRDSAVAMTRTSHDSAQFVSTRIAYPIGGSRGVLEMLARMIGSGLLSVSRGRHSHCAARER